uniref:Uncharacterized protein n=1 Tax=Ditylenchus dipsaci TaxID=166011 RepID=A0A915D1P3_9BILA
MGGVEDELNYEMPTTSKILKPIISPLNSLRSPPDSNELEQERLAKELAHMDLKVSKVLEEKDWDEHIQDFNIRHSVLEIDSNSLCSMCRMEENTVDESREINNLRKKLAEHVDDVNLIESAQHQQELKSAEKDEMPLLPAFGTQNDKDEENNREAKDKERYREELEIQIENKRRLALFEEDKEMKLQNAVNILDAQKYADDQDRMKALDLIEKQKHYQELREQIEVKDYIKKGEELKQEWWEKKPHFTHAINDEKDKGRMFEQLRRHEALKESVLMLEDFKKQQREQDEAARLAHQKQQSYLKHSLQHQASLISQGTGKRSTAEQTNPQVYRAWEEAHRRNDRRYRVLQEVDASGMSGTTAMRATAVSGHRRTVPNIMPPTEQHYEETIVERKRCRKCHRPMRQRKYTSALDRQMKF